MTSTTLPLRALLFSLMSLVTIMRAVPLYADTDFKGRWSGTFYSNHSGVPPFTITVVINSDSRGRIVGSSDLTSHCLKNTHLEVTVTGSSVVLAGSDKEGDNVTLRVGARAICGMYARLQLSSGCGDLESLMERI
jgi:hypothetical protein